MFSFSTFLTLGVVLCGVGCGVGWATTPTKTVTKISWKDCSGGNPIVKVKSLSATEPISLPGDVYASAHFDVTQAMPAPIKLKIKLWRKVLFAWIPIPCIANIGSCTYDDMCQLNPLPEGVPCPFNLDDIGVPCRCPWPQMTVDFTNHLFKIPSLGAILDWLVGGTYSVKVEGENSGRELVCVEADFSMG